MTAKDQLTTLAMLPQRVLTRPGTSSDIDVQGIGPQASEKDTMKMMTLTMASTPTLGLLQKAGRLVQFIEFTCSSHFASVPKHPQQN